jgi:hypothetical protein
MGLKKTDETRAEKLPIHKMRKDRLIEIAIKEGVDRECSLKRLTKDELAEKIYQKRNV